MAMVACIAWAKSMRRTFAAISRLAMSVPASLPFTEFRYMRSARRDLRYLPRAGSRPERCGERVVGLAPLGLVWTAPTARPGATGFGRKPHGPGRSGEGRGHE